MKEIPMLVNTLHSLLHANSLARKRPTIVTKRIAKKKPEAAATTTTIHSRSMREPYAIRIQWQCIALKLDRDNTTLYPTTPIHSNSIHHSATQRLVRFVFWCMGCMRVGLRMNEYEWRKNRIDLYSEEKHGKYMNWMRMCANDVWIRPTTIETIHPSY